MHLSLTNFEPDLSEYSVYSMFGQIWLWLETHMEAIWVFKYPRPLLWFLIITSSDLSVAAGSCLVDLAALCKCNLLSFPLLEDLAILDSERVRL